MNTWTLYILISVLIGSILNGKLNWYALYQIYDMIAPHLTTGSLRSPLSAVLLYWRALLPLTRFQKHHSSSHLDEVAWGWTRYGNFIFQRSDKPQTISWVVVQALWPSLTPGAPREGPMQHEVFELRWHLFPIPWSGYIQHRILDWEGKLIQIINARFEWLAHCFSSYQFHTVFLMKDGPLI